MAGAMFKTGPKFVSFLPGPGGTGTMNDLEFQAAEQRRMQQRALAQAMQKEAFNFGGTEMIGEHAVAKSPWEVLGKLASGAIAAKDQQYLGEQSQADLAKRQEGLSKALGAYMTQREGAPGEELMGPTVDGKPLTTPGTPANPKAAAIAAALSGYKELQGIGAADLAAQLKAKEGKTPAEVAASLAPSASAASAEAMFAAARKGQDPTEFYRKKPEYTSVNPNQPYINPDPASPLPQNPFPLTGGAPPPTGNSSTNRAAVAAALEGTGIGKNAVVTPVPNPIQSAGLAGVASGPQEVDIPRKQWTIETDDRGDKYKINPYTGERTKLDNATRLNVTTNVAAAKVGEDSFVKKHNELKATRLDKEYETASAAFQTNRKLDDLEQKMLKDVPMVTGFGADFITQAMGLGKQLGMNVSEASLRNSQTFDRTVNSILGTYLASMGARLTDKDLETLKNGIVTRGMTPEAIRESLREIRRSNDGLIAQYKAKEEEVIKRYPGLTTSSFPALDAMPFEPPEPAAREPVPTKPGSNAATGGRTLKWGQF